MLDPEDYNNMVNIEMMLARLSVRIKEAAAKRDICSDCSASKHFRKEASFLYRKGSDIYANYGTSNFPYE